MEPKQEELKKRANMLEEECNSFLETQLSGLSEEQVKRRGSTILSQFQKLLCVGHEHCDHSQAVQVVAIPVERIKSLQPPGHLKMGPLFVRIFLDSKEGLLMTVTPEPVSIKSHGLEGVAMAMLPPRQTNYEEVLENGITPQELVSGVLQVLHNSAIHNSATQASARA
jgi:hypothetical protein